MYLAAYREGQLRTKAEADVRMARGFLEQGAEALWIDVEAPTPEELRFLMEQFGLHPLAVEECDHTGVRPKIEPFPGHLYMVLHGMNHNAGAQALDTVEFKFFLTKERLITFHDQPSSSIRGAQERLKRDPRLMSDGVDNVLHQIVDALVDHYFPVVETMEDQVEEFETQVLRSPEPPDLERILTMRRQVLRLVRLIQPEIDVLGGLASGRFPEVDPQDVAYFRDVYDHLLRIGDRIHDLREALGGAMELTLSATSNRANEVMKTLTVVASLVLPLSFLTSLLGMGLDSVPGKSHPYAFWWVLGMAAALAGGIYALLRRARWI